MKNLEREINWLLQEKYFGVENAKFKKDVARLKKGEPLDYVIGFTTFLGCKIDLSRRPLIPRVETEFWVQKAIEKIYHKSYGRQIYGIRVLDMFAGSGCIGVAIMRHIENSHVVFAEKNKRCLDQIRINIKLNGDGKVMSKNIYPKNRRSSIFGVEDKNRFEIIQSDIFSNIKGNPAFAKGFGEARFDYIFANPPYIPTTDKHKVQASVLKYEPKVALWGGEDGLVFIWKFLAEAKNFLNPGGKIYMEFDSPQKPKIEKLAKQYGYGNCEFGKDQYNKWRYVIISDTIK